MPDLTCKQLIDFLDDYLADRLRAGERNRFDAHLRNCRHCREYLDQYRQSIALTRTLRAHPATDSVAAGVPKELVAAIIGSMSQN